MANIDITKTGPQGFRMLQQANNSEFEGVSPEVKELIERGRQESASFTLFNPYDHMEQLVSSPLSNSSTPWGASYFDNKTATEEEFRRLGDVRAENQGWFSKITNGVAKGVILAGTTFLDGTVGLAVGIPQGVVNKYDEDPKTNFWSGLWDNDFSRAMQSITKASEEYLPNYYTQSEQENPWEHVFSANFIGDKFIKNLGFAVGAFYSGKLAASGIKATKLPQIIGTITNSVKAPEMIISGIGAAVSAVNEGRIEALHNSTDWYDMHKLKLDDEYNQRILALKEKYGNTEMFDILLQQENEAYQKALNKLTEDRIKMGNADLLFNIPILMASNLIVLGKMYANGFTSARQATNIIGRAGSWASGSTKIGAATAAIKNAVTEGTEEISQRAASVVSGDYYATDVNNFYKALTDREAEVETLDWMKSFAHGINETVNDGSAWEEFFIGSLTGLLGIPTFRSMKNTEGKFQIPIELQGGAYNSWKEYREREARETEIANKMNARVNSPEFLNYYRGLIRHNKYQKDMNTATEQGDPFNFKNAEHAQLVSDIAMFDNAGKLDELFALINSAYSTSDENLSSIVENTTRVLEDGSRVGPFIDSKGNPMYATPEGKKEMIELLSKNKEDITKTIKDYVDIKKKIDISSNFNLTDEQLEELTWMHSQLKNWAKRAEDMSGDIRTYIGNVIGTIETFKNFNQQLRDIEGQKHANLTEVYRQLDSNVQSLEKTLASLNYVRNLDNKYLSELLSTQPKFVEGLIKEIEGLEDTVATAENKQDIINKLKDIIRLGNAIDIYQAKLEEYTNNPEKQIEDHNNINEEAVQQEEKNKVNTFKNTLTKAKSLKDFKELVDAYEDENIKQKTLKSLEEEGNTTALNYKETLQYKNEITKALDNIEASTEAKQDALQLFEDQIKHTETLEQLANPNSIFINNENAFDEVSGGDVEISANRFQEAQYIIQRAMSQVNNDNRFKDRFSPEYKKPIEKREGTVKGDNRDTTGDSGTATTPSVKTSSTTTSTDTSVGNITAEEMKKENVQLVERVESPAVSKGEIKKYYRPAIPELHIEASKLGDFRPFDVVAMEKNGLDFSEIYDYLKEAGAFDYVNEGNLVSKDGNPVELGFMIDPAFEERVSGKSWHTKPTIFIIDTRNNQVVGSLDEGSSVNNFEGLAGLEERVREEYNQSKVKASSPEEVLHITRTIDGYTPLTKLQEWSKKTGDVRTYPHGVGTYNGLTYYKIEAGYRGGDNITIWFRNTPSERILSKTEEILKALKEDKYTSAEAEKLILEEINKETTNGRFIATPTTKVSKIMVGKIPYGTEERSLANIPNVTSDTRTPVFGIIKNGKLITNGNFDVINPMDMSKEGRLYLLIPNAAGKYSPAAVRVKHFNREEFNLDDVTVSSTVVGENIKNAITKLAESTSQDDISSAMRDLAQNLFIQDIIISHFTASAGEGIVISRKLRKSDGSYELVTIDGKEQIKEEKHSVYFNTSKKQAEINGFLVDASIGMREHPELYGVPKDTSKIIKEITDILTGFNLPIQVSAGWINDSSYNMRLINSGVLTSNIIDATVKGSWFTTDYFDSEGKLQSANNPASITPSREAKTPVGGTNSVITGTKITSVFSNSVYYIDLSTNTIKTEKGEIKAITDSNRILLDLAWAQELYGDKTVGINMIDNKVITPEGKVLDRTKQIYLENNEAQTVKDAIADRKNPKTTIEENQTIFPIFNTSLELQNPIEAISDNHSFKDSNEKVGYYEIEGKLYKGFLLPITTIGDVEIHIAKIPNTTKGFGKDTEHIANSTYYAVFPNGKVWKAGKDDRRTHSEMVDYITKALSGNPQRVNDMANEKTLLFDSTSTEPKISSNNIEASQAAFVTQKEKAVNPTDDEFEDDDIIGMLRKTNESEATVWNKEQELEWLNKVLPNIRAEHRLKVVNGLIRVGKKGALAWGQFDKGMIILSDIAAEGTTYHEAFHVVFNLLLEENEKEILYKEAERIYGQKDNISLEEDMAEGFRDYVMTRQKRNLGKKIFDFFKELFIKITNWDNFRPSLMSYYRRINAGEYAKSEFRVSSISESRNREEQYTEEMKEILKNVPKDSEGRLLAPNGKPSNLTEKQYVQVRTKAFINWFGDWINDPENASKVVDNNGEPLVVYHGSPNEFSEFKSNEELGNEHYYEGVSLYYFATNEDVAASYGSNVIPSFLNIRNPYEFDYENRTWRGWKEEIAVEYARTGQVFKTGFKSIEEAEAWRKEFLESEEWKKYGEAESWLEINPNKIVELSLNTDDRATKYLKENSEYDGVIFKRVKGDGVGEKFLNIIMDEYLARNPNQIKSATDNIGTFSTTNNDIRYRIVPNSSFSSLTKEMQKNLLKKGWTEEQFNSISQIERDHAIKCIAF